MQTEPKRKRGRPRKDATPPEPPAPPPVIDRKAFEASIEPILATPAGEESAQADQPKPRKKRGSNTPPAVRARALELLAKGHSCPKIARVLNIDPTTVRRWSYQAGVRQGQDLSGPVSSPEELYSQSVPQPEAPDPFAVLENTTGERLMNAEDVTAAIQAAIEKPGDAAAKYQAAMVGLGLRMLKDVAHFPPQVKSVKDLSILNDVMRKSLGLNDKVGGRLAINLNVLTKASKGQTVEAQIVNEDEDDSGD